MRPVCNIVSNKHVLRSRSTTSYVESRVYVDLGIPTRTYVGSLKYNYLTFCGWRRAATTVHTFPAIRHISAHNLQIRHRHNVTTEAGASYAARATVASRGEAADSKRERCRITRCVDLIGWVKMPRAGEGGSNILQHSVRGNMWQCIYLGRTKTEVWRSGFLCTAEIMLV